MRTDFNDWYRQQDFSARTCEAAYAAGYKLAASRSDKLALTMQDDPLAIGELLADGNRERERLWKALYNIVDALKAVVGQDAAMCSTEHLPDLIRTLRLPAASPGVRPAEEPQP